MESNYKFYSPTASFARIKEILNQSDINYTEENELPDRSKLTFKNGFYANCSALFIDIRGSSKLPSKYRRPTIARLYRAYISEVVAILNGTDICREINIVGDGAWAVYNTPKKSNIDDVFSRSAMLMSMVKVLNYELGKKSIEPISVGIGLSYGRALMIKAGYSGSGINDVVYMGDVVNEAAKLAANGSQSYIDKPIMISGDFHCNLNEENESLVYWNSTRQCWHANVVNSLMDEWYDENCT